MHVTIYTADRGSIEIETMPDTDAAELIEDFKFGPGRLITVTLDDNAACHIARQHIVRIDVG